MNTQTETTLIFIANRYQWRAAQEAGLPGPKDIMVTASSDIYFACRLEGRSCLSLWDYLPPEESVQHENWAWDLCDRIGEGFRDASDSEDSDLARVICYDGFHPLVAALNLSLCISRVLTAKQPGRVRHFAERQQMFCLDGGTRPAPDVFNLLVALLAGRRGIPVETLALSESVRTAIRIDSASPLQGRYCNKAEFPRDPVRAIAFTQSVFYAEQELLIESLCRDWGGHVLTVMPDPTNLDGPYLSWTHLRRLPVDPPGSPDEKQARQVLARALADLGLPEYAAVLGSPEYASFFLRGWREWLAAAAIERGIARLCALAYRPAYVLLPYDVEGVVRSMAGVWKACGVPALSVDHVGLTVQDMERRNIGASSHAAVWGRYDAAAHRRWRDPAARIFETGSMRRDLGEAAELGQRRCTLKSARTLRSTVLVITAEYGSDLMAYGGIAGTEEVLSWWEGLCALSVRQTGWDWRLKMHPRFDRAVFYRYVLSAQSHRLEQVSGELVAALETADVMLLMVNPSTSAAHAILAGVPVVYFKPASTPESWASPLEKGGASVVSDFAGLESELKRLFGDAVYRQQVVVTQRAFLDRALVAVGEASVEKARGALDELIRSRAAAKGPDAAARWLLDLLMIVDYGMRGALGWPAFRDRLRELGRRGKKLTFEHLPGIQTADLADMLMNITLVAIWWRPEQERRIGKNRPWLGRILWRVYRALPDSIRPLPIWLLPYLRRTLEEEPLFNTDSRFWRWIGSRNPTVSRGPPIPDRQM